MGSFVPDEIGTRRMVLNCSLLPTFLLWRRRHALPFGDVIGNVSIKETQWQFSYKVRQMAIFLQRYAGSSFAPRETRLDN